MKVTIVTPFGTFEDCVISLSEYKYGGTYIKLFSEIGEPICTATAWAPETPLLPSNHCLIKNYSENEGVLQSLVKAGAIEDTGKTVPTKHTHLHVCKLAKEFINE